MRYSRSWLVDEINSGKSFDFIMFWGHQPLKNGEIGKTCFSQWFVSPFLVDNIKYPTAEHWMMAEKARLFNDKEIWQKIVATTVPEEVKSLGRKIKNFDNKIWDNHKFDIVKTGNINKFSQNNNLKEFLLSTKNQIIVEASPYDQIWGIGMGKENPDALNPEKWNGENLLGFAIMEVRDELIR